MSKIQDIFGADPKSVLAKPFMHLQDQKPTATHGGTSASGYNDRDLNTILTNEISGASLLTNEVTLPAGTYYIEATAAGYDAAQMRNFIRDSADNDLLIGKAVYTATTTGDIVGVAGQVTLAQATSIKLVTYISTGQADNGLGSRTSEAPYEVYSDLRIWQLDKSFELNALSDPTMTLKRPMMHVQDQKASGLDGGASGAGSLNDRDLNAILTNEIVGASLSSNEVTLPAGTYFIKAQSEVVEVGVARQYLQTSAGTNLLMGHNTHSIVGGGIPVACEGEVTFAQSTTIKVSTYTDLSVSAGLGFRSNQLPYEVYTDLLIWQLDAVAKAPVLVNNSLYPVPGNAMVTGSMYGLDYSYVSEHLCLVQAGACMDSTNSVPLFLPVATECTIPSVINTIYNIFLCNDETVQADSDPDGANILAGSVTHLRWVGWVRTAGSTNCYSFRANGDWWEGTISDWWFIQQNISNIGVNNGITIDHSAIMPVDRVRAIQYGVSNSEVTESVLCTTLAANASALESVIGAAKQGMTSGTPDAWGDMRAVPSVWLPWNPDREFYIETGGSTAGLLLRTLRMKR